MGKVLFPTLIPVTADQAELISCQPFPSSSRMRRISLSAMPAASREVGIGPAPFLGVLSALLGFLLGVPPEAAAAPFFAFLVRFLGVTEDGAGESWMRLVLSCKIGRRAHLGLLLLFDLGDLVEGRFAGVGLVLHHVDGSEGRGVLVDVLGEVGHDD